VGTESSGLVSHVIKKTAFTFYFPCKLEEYITSPFQPWIDACTIWEKTLLIANALLAMLSSPKENVILDYIIPFVAVLLAIKNNKATWLEILLIFYM